MQKTERGRVWRGYLLSSVALVFLFLAAPPAQAEEQAGYEVQARHDDWAVICKKADKADCRATYSVVDKESGTLVVHWAVAHRASDAKYAVRIRLPLGIWMADGISIRIGENQVGGIAITNCDLLGCYVNALLGEPIITSMLTGEEGEMIFRGPDRGEIKAPASMKGFAKAAAFLSAVSTAR